MNHFPAAGSGRHEWRAKPFTTKEKVLMKFALRDRLRHLDQLGVPKDHELVNDTEKLLNKIEAQI